MGLDYSSVVDAPIDEVFAWHSRPGAVVRLTPPWQPLRVVSEARSLRDGRAELRLIPGLNWAAQHVAGEYREPYRFVDQLDSLPLSALISWRHNHRFAAEGEQRTRVTDHVETVVPASVLRPMFAYRHRQLAADLAAHRWAARLRPEPLTVAVSGSSGLVGSALTAFLSTGGHRVISLVRREPRNDDERRWNPEAPDDALLSGVDAVVHLAGAPIFGRFTPRHKRRVYDSRVPVTRRLAEAAARAGVGVFVSASAIGYYGADRGDEQLTESSARGEGFVSDVVADWEAATEPAAEAGIRVVCVRTGIVQSPGGGVLQIQRPIFAAGLGGRLGSGRQWLSWIGIDDMLDVYLRALVDDRLSGPVNAVAPNPVRNDEFTQTLARVMRRPALLPVPPVAPKLLLGDEGVEEFVLANQHVDAERLRQLGHRFRHDSLDAALRHLLGKAPTA